MFQDEPHQDAFKAAAQATRARIRRDRAQAPRALRRLFTVVATKLFHPSLNANEAWKAAGIRDRTLRTVFRDATDTSLGRYIAAARIEVADVLMITTDLGLTSISLRVGYIYHPTFAENYKRLKGKKPSAVVRETLPPPETDDATSLMAVRGVLDEDAAVRHIEELLRIYPSAAKRIQGAADAEPQIMVDGARCDQLKAEGLWQQIRDLPFAEQCQSVRRYLFCSPVLFDLLREKSRLEGRKSRRRGVEVAELALVSLESSDQIFGDRIHDLRALGWAWLGNAHRLALDFTAASGAFEHADREWSTPRKQTDLLVLANICALKGSLWMVRREYDAATRELDRSCSLFQQSGQACDEARELITRATIHIYAGKLGEAVEDLQSANGLIDQDQEQELAFAVQANLANALVKAGKTKSAAKELDRAREINRTRDDPLGRLKLDWIDGLIGENHGDLEAAKRYYLSARTGFREAGEPRYFALVSVDLMLVHSMQDEWENVSTLAAETLPILGSTGLDSGTLATVLTQAVAAEGLPRHRLNELRKALRQDPLAM